MTSSGPSLCWINFWKPKDAWYYLPRPRREELLRAWGSARDDAIAKGARLIGVYECRAETRWARVSLWEFPSLDVLISLVAELEERGYYEYFAEQNMFGRRTTDPYANYMIAADLTERGGEVDGAGVGNACY